MAQLTQQGKVCAWVDVSDALHPESAAAAGVDLDRMLWVRCGDEASPDTSGRTVEEPCPVEMPQTTRVNLGGNSPHPRSESKGLPSAIGDLLGVKAKYKRDRIIGTPGAPNRPLGAGATAEPSRKEQVASDRMPARRGAYVLEQREAYEPRCAEPQRKPRPQKMGYDPVAIGANGQYRGSDSRQNKPWSRLEQALRVTDLLLQAGGFSAIVLDMGGIAAEFASRVPMATWFRYRAAAEKSQSSFVLLTQHPCAKSSAGVVLHLDAARPLEAGATVFAGRLNHIELSRQRFEQEAENVVSIRKPPQRAKLAEWRSMTAWTGRQGWERR